MIIAGTGHRPPKLGGYCNRKQVEEFAIKFMLDQGLHHTPTEIISGGALGWDQAIAYAAMVCGIPYKMYIPFEGFNNKWPDESIDYFERLIDYAQEVKYICEPGYASYKLQIRNEAMVTDCNILVALYDGSAGGTRNCIYYANSVRGGRKPVVNLWSAWQQFCKKEEVTWPVLKPK